MSTISKKYYSYKDAVLYIVYAVDSNKRNAYYFLAMSKLKELLFKKESQVSAVNLNKYGTIILSSYGFKPNDDEIENTKKEFISFINKMNSK